MSNFTNNRWFAALMLLFLTANVVTLAILWMHNKKEPPAVIVPPGPQEQVFEFVTRELKLDTAQQEAYAKLREEHQAGVRPMQDSLRKLKDRFFSLLQQASPTDSLIQRYSREAADLDQQLTLFTFRHFQKLRAICNPEQQQRFDKIIEEVIHRLAPDRRRGMPPPPPRKGGHPGNMPPPPEGPDGPEGGDGPRH